MGGGAIFEPKTLSMYLKKKKNKKKITKYFSDHPLPADTSFKLLSLILFEIWHLQNFILIYSKGRNFTMGDNQKKIEKYTSAIFT